MPAGHAKKLLSHIKARPAVQTMAALIPWSTRAIAMIQYFRDSMSNIWDPARASRPIIKGPFLDLSRSEYQAMIGVAERE
jgi:hypothetical protein